MIDEKDSHNRENRAEIKGCSCESYRRVYDALCFLVDYHACMAPMSSRDTFAGHYLYERPWKMPLFSAWPRVSPIEAKGKGS